MAITFPPVDQSPWTNPDTGEVFIWDATQGSWKREEEVTDGGIPEPPADDTLYGRLTESALNSEGEHDSKWEQAVDWSGDEMSGPLSSPALTTGPDADDKAVLYMDNAADAFNGGPHELEAKEGEATDWEAWFLNQAPEVNNWKSVTYGNGKWVAVASSGNNNRIMYASDPTGSWTAVAAPENSDWVSVTYAEGKFVAVAYSGTNRIMYASDPAGPWTAVAAPGSSAWYDVTYGNGYFVAVANSGSNRIMYASDPTGSWTAVAAPEDNDWFGVTYGNGYFVAVGYSGTNRIMYASDPAGPWTAVAAPEDNAWYDVTYGNGKFVAVAGSGNNRIMYAEDPTDENSWTAVTATEANGWSSVTYGNGHFVAVAYSGYNNRIMYTSDPTSPWTAVEAPEKIGWYSVNYGNGYFVAVAYSGYNNRIMTLETHDVAGGLFFDGDLIYTEVQIDPLMDKVNLLTKEVVNLAEEIEIIAPSIFHSVWDYSSHSNTPDGSYAVEPIDGTYASVTKVILSTTDKLNKDHTTQFSDVDPGDTLSILDVDDSFGLSGIVTSTSTNGDGDFEINITSVRAFDDPNGIDSYGGPAVISVKKTVPVQGGPIVTWSGDALPTTTPDGGDIIEATLFYNTSDSKLYIYIGGAWREV